MARTSSQDVLTTLARRWLVLLLGTVIGGAIGVGILALLPLRHDASAVLVVVPTGDTEPGATTPYAQAFGRMASRVGEAVGADVRGSSFPDAPMFEVTASASDPDVAADEANGAAEAVELFFDERSATTGFSVELLVEARPPDDPSFPSTASVLAASAAAGLIVAGVVATASPGRGRLIASGKRQQPLWSRRERRPDRTVTVGAAEDER